MSTFAKTVVVLLAIIATGCGENPLKGAINAAWPPIDHTEQALTAVEQAKGSVDALKDPNIAVSLSETHAKSWIERTLTKQAPEIKEPKIEFGPQQIILEANFEKALTDPNVALSGRLLGRVLVGADTDTLILTPAFLSVHVDKVKYKGSDTEVVAPLVNAALKEYLDNVNGQIKPVLVDLGLSHAVDWNIAEEIGKSPGVTSVSAPDIEAQLALAGSSVLVDTSGVHALGRGVVSRGTDRLTEKELRELCASPLPTVPDIHCRSDLFKLLCETEKAFRRALAQSEIISRERLCATVSPEVATTRIEPRTDASLEEHFQAFRTAFLQKRQELTGKTDFEDRSQLAISRVFIARAINEVLAVPAIKVSMTIAPPTQTFSQDIRLAKAPDLKCRENLRSCDIQQECGKNSCNGWPCNYNCKGYQLDCHARKGACEFNKAGAIKACEANEVLKKGFCEADKEAKRLDCERLKGMEIAGCEVNQGWLNTWSEHKIGKLDGKVDVVGEIDGRLQTLSVGEDLSSVEVDMAINGSAKIDAVLGFVPANIGNLGCTASWKGPVSATVLFRDEDLKLKGGVSFANAEGTKPARVVLQLPEREVDVQVVPPPLAALVAKNPILLVICAPAAIGYGTATKLQSAFGGESPPELTGLYKQKVGPLTQEIALNPVSVKVRLAPTEDPETFMLTPSWSEKAAVFLVAQK